MTFVGVLDFHFTSRGHFDGVIFQEYGHTTERENLDGVLRSAPHERKQEGGGVAD